MLRLTDYSLSVAATLGSYIYNVKQPSLK